MKTLFATVRLTAEEAAAWRDGSLAAVLDAEDRHGGQRAAIEAEPELAACAPLLQRVRAKFCAAALGVELRGDGRPFPPEVVADASRAFRAALLSPYDPDALG
jgi:hypothetical protein